MKAEGIAEINAALRDSLIGVWLAYDGDTLTADIRVRPTGMPEHDALVTELFGSLPSREESIKILRQALPDEFGDEPQLADREGLSRSSTGASGRCSSSRACAWRSWCGATRRRTPTLSARR